METEENAKIESTSKLLFYSVAWHLGRGKLCMSWRIVPRGHNVSVSMTIWTIRLSHWNRPLDCLPANLVCPCMSRMIWTARLSEYCWHSKAEQTIVRRSLKCSALMRNQRLDVSLNVRGCSLRLVCTDLFEHVAPILMVTTDSLKFTSFASFRSFNENVDGAKDAIKSTLSHPNHMLLLGHSKRHRNFRRIAPMAWSGLCSHSLDVSNYGIDEISPTQSTPGNVEGLFRAVAMVSMAPKIPCFPSRKCA